MKTLIVTSLLLFSFASFASGIECSTGEHIFQVKNIGADLTVTYNGETVLADGVLLSDEVDLVAKLKSVGEMTLFAKIGKSGPENYVFLKGKRFSVICR